MENEVVTKTPEGEQLEHHGTKGMRWGVRRYQNPDGSLTPAGKKRYGDGETRETTKAKERAAKLKTKSDKLALKIKQREAEERAKAKADRLEAEIKAQKARLKGKKVDENKTDTPEETKVKTKTDAEKKAEFEAGIEKARKSSDPNEILKYKGEFNARELQEIVSRIELEKRLANMIPKEPTVMDRVMKVADTAGNIATSGEKFSKLYNSIARINNAFNEDHQLPIINLNDKGLFEKKKDDTSGNKPTGGDQGGKGGKGGDKPTGGDQGGKGGKGGKGGDSPTGGDVINITTGDNTIADSHTGKGGRGGHHNTSNRTINNTTIGKIGGDVNTGGGSDSYSITTHRVPKRSLYGLGGAAGYEETVTITRGRGNLTIEQAAKKAGVSPSTISRLISEGNLDPVEAMRAAMREN